MTYDPLAKCSKIEKFISEVLRPEDIPTIQEFIGYCLWKDYPNAKSLLFVGDGENGKSTLIGVVKALLGIENIASRPPQELEYNRFAKAKLYGKLANLSADLPDQALRSTGTFKMLTGRDPLTAEFKFRNGFSFINYAKLIFSANKVPEVFEDTTGFFRRWIIITFPNTFAGDKADKNLLEKMTTSEEFGGFLNWALEGLKRLRDNGWDFSNAKSVEIVREEYIRKSSPIKAFLMEATVQIPDGFVVKQELCEAYCEYCRSRNLPVQTRKTFFSKLPQFGQFPTEQRTIKEKRCWGFVGLHLKPKDEWGVKEDSDDEPAQPAQPAQPLPYFKSTQEEPSGGSKSMVTPSQAAQSAQLGQAGQEAASCKPTSSPEPSKLYRCLSCGAGIWADIQTWKAHVALKGNESHVLGEFDSIEKAKEWRPGGDRE